MAKEIEKKFLIDRDKIGRLTAGSIIEQAYIATKDKTAVRIRIAGSQAFLTLKGENHGLTRSEFEYEIPVEDAREIMAELCTGPSIEKTRYLIRHASHTWEVDVFDGDNEGLIVAEIELTSETECFELPAWVTTDVSGDAKYYNSNLLNKPFKDWGKNQDQEVILRSSALRKKPATRQNNISKNRLAVIDPSRNRLERRGSSGS